MHAKSWGQYGTKARLPPLPQTHRGAACPISHWLYRATHPVVPTHRSSPAPSTTQRWRCMGAVRVQTLPGLGRTGRRVYRATHASPRSRGGYRPAGAPNSERAVRTGRLADPCPLNVGLFGAGSDAPPTASHPGLPAGMGRGGDTSSGVNCLFWAYKPWGARPTPAPHGAGHGTGRVVRFA